MKKDSFDFGQKSAELESVLQKIQQPDTPVDEILALYDRGTKLAAELEKYLQTAQNKLEKIQLVYYNLSPNRS